jgi:serine/threonine protein kinase
MELLTGGELFSRIRSGQYNEKGAPLKTRGSGICAAQFTYVILEDDTAHSPPAEAARLVREIVRTVAQAHSRGVIIRSGAGTTTCGSCVVCRQQLQKPSARCATVTCAASRRDVKPDNFLFLNSNEQSGLRAIDFGLAEYCKPGQYLTDRVKPSAVQNMLPAGLPAAKPRQHMRPTQQGMAHGCAVRAQAGTVIYIAPEVLRNKYTLSADLWSVGIIAYLLLTGRLPFAGEEGEEVSDLFIRKQTFQNRVHWLRANCWVMSIASVIQLAYDALMSITAGCMGRVEDHQVYHALAAGGLPSCPVLGPGLRVAALGHAVGGCQALCAGAAQPGGRPAANSPGSPALQVSGRACIARSVVQCSSEVVLCRGQHAVAVSVRCCFSG